jgi:chemotaxis protein methyltransferase CheR
MIYFDAQARRRILERFSDLLEPGGLLFLGHSENVADTRGAFRPLGQTVYLRTDRHLANHGATRAGGGSGSDN